jgi:hypothetical protein
MRISSNPKHPDYYPGAWQCRVFLAGSERKHVTFADEERRMAKHLRLDQEGKPQMDKEGELIEDSFWGDVRIDCPDEFREMVAVAKSQTKQPA